MFRKFVAVSMLVSFVAMSTSGMMMFVIEKSSFTIQMHPVHKLFGLIMVLSTIAHLFYNHKALLNYLKTKAIILPTGNRFAYVASEHLSVKKIRAFLKQSSWRKYEFFASSYWNAGIDSN